MPVKSLTGVYITWGINNKHIHVIITILRPISGKHESAQEGLIIINLI
jgi:hypothetical protein